MGGDDCISPKRDGGHQMRFIQSAPLRSTPGKAQNMLVVVPAVLGPIRARGSESPTQGDQAVQGPPAGHVSHFTCWPQRQPCPGLWVPWEDLGLGRGRIESVLQVQLVTIHMNDNDSEEEEEEKTKKNG